MLSTRLVRERSKTLSDAFVQPLEKLVSAVFVSAAGFCDLDGEEIAVFPPTEREAIRQAAAVSGVALRRLNMAERLSGRENLNSISVRGDSGSTLTCLVADEYQLVVIVNGEAPQSKIRALAMNATASLKAKL